MDFKLFLVGGHMGKPRYHLSFRAVCSVLQMDASMMLNHLPGLSNVEPKCTWLGFKSIINGYLNEAVGFAVSDFHHLLFR